MLRLPLLLSGPSGVTQEPYSHRFGDTDDDWSSSASSEQPHDIEEGDGSRSREMDLLGEEERPTGVDVCSQL